MNGCMSEVLRSFFSYQVAVGNTTYHSFANKNGDTGRLKLMAALGVDTRHERCAGKHPNEKDWQQLIEKLGRLFR